MSTPRQPAPANPDDPTWEQAKWIGATEAAGLLGCTERTVQRMADDGRLEVGWLTDGGHRRFDAAHVAEIAAGVPSA